jgi:hypothetical protein
LIGIKKSGINDYSGIPAFLYKADVQYFAILTFFIIFAIINVQQDQLRGYQILLLFLGFWCAHWLIYDWAWWVLEIGFGHVNLSTFWTKPFYSPLLIENPPMWLFLLEAILGAFVSIYTFSIPDNFKKLVPSLIWLYTVYANASVCSLLGLNTLFTLLIGIFLIIVVFSLMLFYTLKKIRTLDLKNIKNQLRLSDWTINPLSFPYFLVFIAFFVLSYIFSLIEPIIGILLGMIPWYVMPGIYTFVKATRSAKFSRRKQIFTIILIIVIMVILTIFLAVAVGR